MIDDGRQAEEHDGENDDPEKDIKHHTDLLDFSGKQNIMTSERGQGPLPPTRKGSFEQRLNQSGD